MEKKSGGRPTQSIRIIFQNGVDTNLYLHVYRKIAIVLVVLFRLKKKKI